MFGDQAPPLSDDDLIEFAVGPHQDMDGNPMYPFPVDGIEFELFWRPATGPSVISLIRLAHHVSGAMPAIEVAAALGVGSVRKLAHVIQRAEKFHMAAFVPPHEPGKPARLLVIRRAPLPMASSARKIPASLRPAFKVFVDAAR